MNRSEVSDTFEVSSQEEEEMAAGLPLLEHIEEDTEQQRVLDLDEIDVCLCTWMIVERQGMACLRRECQGHCDESVECQEIGEICLPLQ